MAESRQPSSYVRSYTVPEHVISANLADESVLLHMDTKDYFQLNATGQHIWMLLERGASGDAIVADLTAKFDVTAQEAAAEYTRLTAELEAHGLLAQAP